MSIVKSEKHDIETGAVVEITIKEDPDIERADGELEILAAIDLISYTDYKPFFEYDQEELYYDLCKKLRSAVDFFEGK